MSFPSHSSIENSQFSITPILIYEGTAWGNLKYRTIHVAKTKALISFAYAKSRFSHDEAHFTVVQLFSYELNKSNVARPDVIIVVCGRIDLP